MKDLPQRATAIRCGPEVPAPDGAAGGDSSAGGPLRFAVALGAVAAVITAVVVVGGPAGPDLPAHLFQRDSFIRHGLSLWDNYWYAGHYDFVTYSLLYYPVTTALGLLVTTTMSVAIATSAFCAVVEHGWGRRSRAAAVAFAVVWPGVAVTGVLPFALGAAFCLVAVAALQRGANRTFAVCAVLALAASPLAFLFLAIALVAPVVARAADWRRHRGPVVVMLAASGAELLLWRLFPSHGSYPFWTEDFRAAIIFAVLGVAFSWRRPELSVLRPIFCVYAGACLAAYAVPNELGANIARVRLFAVPVALLLVAVRRWRPIPLCVLLVLAATWWNGTALTAAYGRAEDRSYDRSYWAPAISWLRAHLGPNYRVEAVDTSGHWPAVRLAGADIPLVRGWFRQDDHPDNDVLYRPAMSAEAYLGWLRSLGVRYVVLADARPDWSSEAEAALVRGGIPGLRPVHRAGEVMIYEVADPAGIITGPGEPRLTRLTHAGLDALLPEPGVFRLAVHWSPYWETSLGCLAEAGDGMMTLRTAEPGPVQLRFRARPTEALHVLVGSVGEQCAKR